MVSHLAVTKELPLLSVDAEQTFYFVDNEAARFSLLKGTSGKESMQQLTASFHSVNLVFPSIAWVERIPSESNSADAPSRGRSRECVKAVSGIYSGEIGMPEEVLRAIKSSVGPPTSMLGYRCLSILLSCCQASLPEALGGGRGNRGIAHKPNLIVPPWKKLSRPYCVSMSCQQTCECCEL